MKEENQLKEFVQSDREHYVSPYIEVICIEIEGSVMQESAPDQGDGGWNEW